MIEHLERLVRDAYERGQLDAEMGTTTDLSLFARDAAAAILGRQPITTLAVRHIPIASIAEMPDGRLGVLFPHSARVTGDARVDVRPETKLPVWKFPLTLAVELVEAVMSMRGERDDLRE